MYPYIALITCQGLTVTDRTLERQGRFSNLLVNKINLMFVATEIGGDNFLKPARNEAEDLRKCGVTNTRYL